MVLGAYVGARYSTGGGCLVYTVSVDSTGVREVIKGHNFRVRDQMSCFLCLRVLMLIPEVASKLFLHHQFMIRRGQ